MKNYPHLQIDQSNCDKEPIHIIGTIQAHGFLMVLDTEGKTIAQVSENIHLLTGITAEQCLTMSYEELLPKEVLAEISSFGEASAAHEMVATPFPVVIQEKHYIALLHDLKDKLLLELEPTHHHSLAQLTQLNALQASTFQQLSQKNTINELSLVAAERIQQLFDYDRVMIYQFDEDWHGHVVAEKIKPGVKSYFNHHFPASDIPEQARTMLRKKGIRQIVDVAAESVPLIPYLHPRTGKPTNVSSTELRNPSEIHLEYLQNMEVGATVSIAILVKGNLWGLICGHHQSPCLIDYYQRTTANLITQYYASCILSAKEKDDKELDQTYKQVEKTLIQKMEESLNIKKSLFVKPVTLLDLSSATGAALVLNGKITTLGKCPGQAAIRKLVQWASEQTLPQVYHTQELYKVYPPAFGFKQVASGLLLLELSRHNQEYILYFKPEIKETITWAGNPDKSLQMDAEQRLHPRKSFAKWEQAIEGKSAVWSELEIERIRSLGKTVVSIQLTCQAEKLRDLNTQLEGKNAQMEDFTHIASHNLIAPLNNIQGLLGLYHHQEDFDTAQLVLDKIALVSGHMKQTLQELHQLLKVNQSKELSFELIDLPELIRREMANLSSHIEQTGAQIHPQLTVESLRYPKVYMESILHNFLSNALKYRSPERTPHIKITSWQADGNVLLEIEDNGMGIDLEKYGHKLFGLYKTFHAHADSRGIGLYLVRKQVESLGGSIHVDSQVDVGTRFTVRFPLVGQEDTSRPPESIEGMAREGSH
ncbi:ATP-binding protein [Cytophagaceae bacterium DM2B3-1]|uniref:histidine kinase n=1 Tax=Xanthocytophaga flava TaxID=3048013 RepID=A0ABT7CYN1_9BACT|nr:ATP-binding protein [Xanthocytophaga flavus]MDJ1498888.1 ATP-binding protein [Xanthocytophaga flavus]